MKDISARTVDSYSYDVFSGLMRQILENTIEFISESLAPEEVFDYDELRDWAKDNGFVEEE